MYTELHTKRAVYAGNPDLKTAAVKEEDEQKEVKAGAAHADFVSNVAGQAEKHGERSVATADNTFLQTPAPSNLEHVAEPGKHKNNSRKKKHRADASEAVVVCKLQN